MSLSNEGIRSHSESTQLIEEESFKTHRTHKLTNSHSTVSQCDTVECRMQAVENRGVNFIGNYNWQEFRRARDKSELQSMPAIDPTLQLHADRIWKRLEEILPDMYQQLVEESQSLNIRFKKNWPSSVFGLQ